MIKNIILAIIIFLSFRILAIDPPVIVSPVNNSQTFVSVELDWDFVAGADYYHIQFDTTSGFNSPLLVDSLKPFLFSNSTGADTKYEAELLDFGQQYFWRVRTINSTDTSVWSLTMNFITKAQLNVISPLAGSLEFAGVNLDWDAFPGSEFYNYQFDTNSVFSSSVLIEGDKQKQSDLNNFFDSEFFASQLQFGANYYCRVRAYHSQDTSEWSDVISFQTKDQVELGYPADSAQIWAGDTLDWLAFNGVKEYEYQIDTTLLFNSAAMKNGTDTFQFFVNDFTDTEEFVDDLYFGQKYFWRVRVYHDFDTSAWSEVRMLVTAEDVNIVSPVIGSSEFVGVTIDWMAHEGVDFYDYQIDSSGVFSGIGLISGTNQYLGPFNSNPDTEHFLDELKFDTQYFWRVRARNAVDTTEWSDVYNFTTLDTVTPNAPFNYASVFTKTKIDWLSHEGVDIYNYQLDTSEFFNSPVLIEGTKNYISHQNNAYDTEAEFDDLFYGQKYFWRVRAINVEDSSSWCSTRTFYTRQTVGLWSPDNDIVNVDTAGIMLDWWAHPGTDIYQLEIDSSNLFNTNYSHSTNIVYQYTSNDSADTEHLLAHLDENRYYFWRVRMINASDTSEWEMRWFSTSSIPLALPAVPNLIYPMHLQFGVETNPLLEWDVVSAADAYYIQISETADFLNVPENFSNTNIYQITGLDYLSDYYWRVRSVSGNFASEWSDYHEFTTINWQLPAPDLFSPVFDTVNVELDNLQFQWYGVDGAVGYKLEYSPDTNFTSNVFTVFPLDTATVVGGLQGLTKYFWRVQAVGDTVLSSEWSVIWKFTSREGSSSVEEIFGERIFVFPNPAKDYVNIELPDFNEVSMIRIFSNVGDLVYTENVDYSNILRIDTQNFRQGIYYIQFVEKGITYSKQFIISK